MQLTNIPGPEAISKVRKTLQEERVNRYLSAAGGNPELAFRLYMWNCDLSEAFQLPLHVAEIVCRNAIHRCLLARLGERWFEHNIFRGLLDPRIRQELERAISEERSHHGRQMTAHHIVSALSFGFWQHLATRRFERLLWIRGIQHSFPNAPNGVRRQHLHNQIESVRHWRNRIAHHKAIFDKQPVRKYQETVALIEWVCGDTANWVKSISRVSKVINLRPNQP